MRFVQAGVLVAAMVVLGCGGPASPPEATPDIPAETATSNTAGSSAVDNPTKEGETKEVSVKVMDYDGIQMLIDSYRGQVVVVDIWSTDCPPCIKELPGLVELDEEYPDDQVRCITVSLDYIGLADEGPETYEPRVLGILKPLNVRCTNIIAADDSETMLRKLDLSAPPAVYVYGPDGKLAQRFDNEEAQNENEAFTYEDVKRLVQDLLESKPAAE